MSAKQLRTVGQRLRPDKSRPVGLGLDDSRLLTQSGELRLVDTFEDLYKSDLANMVRLATFILCSNTQAEEVTQEAFLKLHSDWSTVDNPSGYLRTLVVNRCKDLLRRQKVQQSYLRLATPATHSPTTTYLLDVLAGLEPKRRLVVVLKYYGGYTLQEIAEITGFPEGTVRSNLHRGLKQLEEALS